MNTTKHDWTNDPRLPLFYDFAQKELETSGSKPVWIIGGTHSSGSLTIELINADTELRQKVDQFLSKYGKGS